MPNPVYNLWHPVVFPGRTVCAFDAVRMEDRGINQGSADWMAKCFSALGIAAFADSWEIAPFCSPFYGMKNGSHPNDRNPMAWRITVRLQSPVMFDSFPYRAGGAALDVVDPTSPTPEYWKPDYFVFTERPGTVIAAYPDLAPADVLARVGALSIPGVTTECFELTPDLTECRLNFGNLKFPDDEARLTTAAQRVSEDGGSVHWSDLAPYNEV